MNTVRKLILLASLSASLSAFSASASAIEFKSVGGDPAIAYDAPSAKGRKVYVAPRGMPVETVLTYGDWTKVRDSAGDLFWLESKALTPKRMLIVKAPNARIHSAPDDGAALVFSADKGVLLELSEPAAAGWLKVKHRDGQVGYAKVTDVWGGG
ncbi:MAG: hypothetical protein JO269_06305 [Burkholderiaceae bacterium]|nr:hypothetical protein [Burkholderiaceae bacterium]